jgi:FkbM family methyltransferase
MKLRSRILKWYAANGFAHSLRRSAARKFRRAERGRTLVQPVIHGFSLNLRIGDPVDTETVIHGEFEPSLSKLIKRLAPDCSSFVDVGCNIGYFTCLFRKYNAAAPILAIDANPEMIARCEENIRLNRFEGIQALNVGVAEGDGVIPFYVNPESPSLASFGGTANLRDQLAAGTMREIQVRTRPLPDILADAGIAQCGLIKIDIEGYEPSLFAGLTADFHRMAERILFEYVPCQMEVCGFDPSAIWNTPAFREYRAYGLDTKRPEQLVAVTPGEVPAGIDTICLIRKDLPDPFVSNNT